MRIGLALPQYGSTADPHRIAEFASSAEELGYRSLWASDRALTPLHPDPVYPGYTPEQPWPPEQTRVVDPIVALSVASAATTQVRLSTSTLNAPWYTPLLLGRALTSLDLLSQGRLDVGFGTGWMRTEYEALAVPWKQRGARLEEILDILQAMWSTDPVEHHGTVWQIPVSRLELRPFQKPGPPVLLGGFGKSALGRVGRRADGWLPATGLKDGPPIAVLQQLWAVVVHAAETAGRDPGTLRRELRINTAAGHAVEDVVPILHEARDSGFDGAFIDLTYVATGVDHALEIASSLLSRFQAG